ncbi:S1C family serine protease [Urbifossiella limnaea]|uniref:Putative periplasmic serine endoprotease DegP-like n=1 Tax=Urbifossiella limnaea TaxID=2528023 RepID=A0A517XMU8_9BACT|nr:PDZ domain-containing protein [Urbifossiella limnaea]QDU18816.1 putative periplasmic serine endoprotease DegP-like precursor [Urbifossiella limnaea]
MRTRLLVAAALSLTLAGPAAAQPPDGGKRKDRGSSPDVISARLVAPFQPVVAKVNESTVRVLADGKEAALGTVVFADGYVLTKASDLRGELAVKFHDGSNVPAKLVGVEKKTDLALLRIEKKGLTALAFADSKVAALGNWLAAAGVGSDPAGVGIVSVVTRKLSLREQNEFDKLNANRGFLGITMSQTQPADGGAEVEAVSKGGSAEKAGLKRGDIIRRVNDKKIADSDSLREMLNDFRPGQKVNLSVNRKGEALELSATLAGPPADMKNQRSDIQNTMGGALSNRRGGFEQILQTDMVVDPKNCGGAVVDLDGRVIGVCISRAGRVETYVLPGEVVRPLLADLRAGKFPPPAAPVSLPTAPAPRPVRSSS